MIDITAARMSAGECGDDFTGLVFAGYGTGENYPSFRELRIGGLFDSGLQAEDMGGVTIDAGNTSWIEAFAQRDVVDSYLTGMDEDMKSKVANTVASLLDEVTETIADASDAKTEEMIREDNDALLRRFDELLDEYAFRNYMWPVKSYLRFLSKDEMASLAESLITLTYLRRRASDDYETVRGPVDVAIISKHEGFVWIKHKLYFKKDLNIGYDNLRG